MSDALATLNPEQRHAVETIAGPLLVLAGAGTGKTRVITTRVGHLIGKGVKPEAILAMTFTNKAASEMKERVQKVVGKRKSKNLWVGTFHAFCARLLRNYGQSIGVPPNYAICDASDQIAAAKGALRELRVPETKLQPRDFLACVSLAKNQLLTHERFLERAGGDREELIGRAWKRYDGHLTRTRALDFDDLLLKTVELVQTDAKVKGGLEERFHYVLVDEFQDTNGVQFEILRQITERRRNLCVVGDDDQSIYGWRGADITKILGFEKSFPGAKVVRLETNYRSTSQILRASNRLIANNPNRHGKELRAASPDGPPVTALSLRDETEEADYVCREVQELVRDGGARLEDFAVLFRTATQPRAFEAQFRARGIPYVLIGGQSFFDRKEVRDVLAYLRLVANPLDEVSFLRVVNCPPRGVGKASLDKIVAHATKLGVSAASLLEHLGDVDGLSASAVEAIGGFRRLLANIASREPTKDLVEWVELLLREVRYRDEVERVYDDAKQVEDRWSGVVEILNFAENYVSRSPDPTLIGFLDELSLSAADDRSEEDDSNRRGVTFMTLHAAKGLEFQRVFLVGVEEGLLPHLRSIVDDTVDEERRIAYVGMTRARFTLTLTYAMERSKYGRRVECMPSRFLFELQGVPPPANWRAAQPEAPQAKKKKKRKKAVRRVRGAK